MLLELYVLNVIIFDLKSLSFWKNTLFFPVRRIIYVHFKWGVIFELDDACYAACDCLGL